MINTTKSPVSKSINYLCWFLFLLLFLISLWACLDIGQSWDEGIERLTLSINLAAIQGLIAGDMTAYRELLQYGDRYYGIGFHLPALLVSQILQQTLPDSIALNNPNLTHISVLLCFFGSALITRSILLRITNQQTLANSGMLIFALWPYLLGHALMNVKDMPFLFAWLLCTYFALKYYFSDIDTDRGKAQGLIKKMMPLAIATGWLLSIRIAGVLIFLEYVILFLSAFLLLKIDKVSTFSEHNLSPIKVILTFTILCVATLIVLYPIAWHNPFEIFNAITYMSHHPWDGTTLTAGRFITPGQQVGFYLFVWIAVKLPFIAALGLALSPLAIYKKLNQQTSNRAANLQSTSQWIGLFCSALAIICVLIIRHVALYNEARQILFLFPLLFICGISSLYFISKKICIAGMVLTGALFIWDNLTLYPYNYAYLNEIARQRLAIQYFETDYFGISAGRAGRWINTNATPEMGKCIYAYPTHLLAYELTPSQKECLIDSAGHAQNMEKGEPALLFITQRNLINFQTPQGCRQLHSEEKILPLSKNPLIMGKIYQCFK